MYVLFPVRPVVVSGSRVFNLIASAEFCWAFPPAAARKSASKRCLSKPTLGVQYSLCVAANEGVEFFFRKWLVTVWCYAVDYCSSLHSCSSALIAARPDRGYFTVPHYQSRQAGIVRPIRLLWLTAHAVEVCHCYRRCTSAALVAVCCRRRVTHSARLRKRRLDFSPLTGRT